MGKGEWGKGKGDGEGAGRRQLPERCEYPSEEEAESKSESGAGESSDQEVFRKVTILELLGSDERFRSDQKCQGTVGFSPRHRHADLLGHAAEVSKRFRTARKASSPCR